jgi:acetyl esterase/lipase
MQKFSRWAAAVVAVGLLAPLPALAAPRRAPRLACTGDPSATHRLDLAPTYGFYALPAKKPAGIVLYDHGYGHNAEDWQQHLTQTAQRDGVIAVAVNYVATEGTTRGGWRVSEGADATVAAGKLFERACPFVKAIVAYGISMGGNTSGLVAASHAMRHDGRPLFDYWFDIEGATNVIETYLGARVLAPVNAFAAGAQKDIEAEMGGPLEARPQAYADHAVVTKAEDIKASGIRGVVMVHGVGDGLVPYDQSREMQARLRQVGIPVEFFTAGTHGPSSEAGTTLDGYVPVPHDSPFAGHGSEVSNTQLVIKTGFDRLAALYGSGDVPSCREFFIDGTTGVTVPVPSTGC